MFASRHENGRAVWPKTWALTLLLTVVVLAGFECFWRTKGHLPSVIDDKDLWAYHRHRADRNGRKTIVLLGASRMQLDISIPRMREMLPGYAIVQLSIDGTHPMASFRDLSLDQDFDGIAICSIIEAGLEPRHWDHQQDYVAHYQKNGSANNRINRLVSAFLQDRFVAMDPYLNLKRVIKLYVKDQSWPVPKYFATRLDRSRDADYTKLDIEKHRRKRLELLKNYYEKFPPYSPDKWLEDARAIEPWVESIRKRGGKVLFVRFPTSGEHWELDEKMYPKSEFWDKFAAATHAETMHFQDVASLKGFDLPDASHLDFRNKPRFTQAFVNELIARKIVVP